MARRCLAALSLALLSLGWASPPLAPAPAMAADGTVRDGNARFQVLTPTLIRIEYSPDRRFEDRPSLNAVKREFEPPPYEVRRDADQLTITTRRMTVRYRRGSGRLGPRNLSVELRVAGKRAIGRPSFPPPTEFAGPPSMELSPSEVRADLSYRAPTSGNLGGWYRSLDLVGEPVRLHDGLLSRDGWYLLDDSQTVLSRDAPPGFAPRPVQDGTYQDGYLFGYGHHYARGLRDLRALTGAAPLLPRQAFGIWWSKWAADHQDSYPPLLDRFRADGMNLDVLMIDTDARGPHLWNGWNWSPRLMPDPRGFLEWADRERIAVGLNLHPSITFDDPKFPEANRRAGGTGPVGGLRVDPVRCRAFVAITDLGFTGVPILEEFPPEEEISALPAGALDCRVFNWARAGDQNAYFWLHQSFERDGVDLFWLDYCCDESDAVAAGATDAWINHLYAERSRGRRSRWPSLSRVGGSLFDVDTPSSGIWSEHRNTIHFTGDTEATWEMQTAFTAAEGNVGIPYVTHDIGSFSGRHLSEDMYVRWVQSGTFQPLLRLHSHHGDRLPWEYGARAERIATRFLRLRGRLIPYLYTLARRSHDTGLPMARAMYLRWPERDAAYRRDRQYMLGPDLLVAPVGTPGAPATKEVWFPPGAWVDVFTGRRHRGPKVERLRVPLGRMPVFARGGAIVPLQGLRPTGNTRPPRRLLVDAYAGRRGAFTLYEDEGDGLSFRRGQFARTRIVQRRARQTTVVRIGPARGNYRGRLRQRAYELRVLGARPPGKVRVRGRRLPRTPPGTVRGWWYDRARGAVIVRTGRLPSAQAARFVLRAR